MEGNPIMWQPDPNEENLGYPKPEDFESMTQDEFETYCDELGLPATQYEYARLDAYWRKSNYISNELEKADMDGPTVIIDRFLELGWLEWGQPLHMNRGEYETLYKECTHWSSFCESPIECILYDEVRKIGLDPNINSTLGDLLFHSKRDIAGRFTNGAGERYDQIYFNIVGDRPVPILIVECDGEAYHMMKVADIKKDAKKEQNLCSHFPHILVLRFSGSHIKNNRKECASIIKSTFDFLCSIYPHLKGLNSSGIQQYKD
jgi:hypothetical protein